MESIYRGRDTFGCFPTGFVKSLIFQSHPSVCVRGSSREQAGSFSSSHCRESAKNVDTQPNKRPRPRRREWVTQIKKIVSSSRVR